MQAAGSLAAFFRHGSTITTPTTPADARPERAQVTNTANQHASQSNRPTQADNRAARAAPTNATGVEVEGVAARNGCVALQSTGGTHDVGSDAAGGAQRTTLSGTDVSGEEKDETEEERNGRLPTVPEGDEGEHQDPDGGAAEGEGQGLPERRSAAGDDVEEGRTQGGTTATTHPPVGSEEGGAAGDNDVGDGFPAGPTAKTHPAGGSEEARSEAGEGASQADVEGNDVAAVGVEERTSATTQRSDHGDEESEEAVRTPITGLAQTQEDQDGAAAAQARGGHPSREPPQPPPPLPPQT